MFLVLTSTKGEQHGTFYSSIKNAPLWAHVVVSDQNNNCAEKLRVMLCLGGGQGPMRHFCGSFVVVVKKAYLILQMRWAFKNETAF